MRLHTKLRIPLVVTILLLPIRIALADGPATRAADLQWGAASKGARATLIFEGRDTYEYHPGEPLKFFGMVQNAADHATRFQAVGMARSAYVMLHVSLPDGPDLIESPGLGLDASKPPWKASLQDISPHGVVLVCRNQFRLGDAVEMWVDPASPKDPITVSFRTPGKYEFWYVYSVPPGRDSWSGTISSNHVTITILELSVEKRLQKPTPGQVAALQQLLGPGNGSVPHQGFPELEKAILATENEGLALHMMDLIDKNPTETGMLCFLIEQRCGQPGDGIDGPYLQRLADQNMKAIESGRPRPPIDILHADGSTESDMTGILAYLHFHPQDAKFKGRAVSVAKPAAKVSLAPSGPTARPFIDIMSAWRILIDAGVLHDGMNLTEATDILGKPSSDEAGTVVWSLDLSNPGDEASFVARLSATLADGKLSRFHSEIH